MLTCRSAIPTRSRCAARGVTAKVEKNRSTLAGIDKEQLGQLAAVIRDQRPPEPYKGKGIKYVEETDPPQGGQGGAS